MGHPKPQPLTPALFCDRDGVLMEEVGYIRHAADVRLIPGVGAALRRFADARIPIVSVSNQSGVARGIITVAEVEAVQARLAELLWSEAGVRLAAMYFAPHHPQGTVAEFTGEHDDRKPRPGMLLKAAAAFPIDLARSWIVGDRLTDLEAGRNAGLAGAVLVKTGYGLNAVAETPPGRALPWDLLADSLPAAADAILQRMQSNR
ncbi:MAG TPA: HAD family hydrolase [Planctomycetota bacterium]|nr:HAD family hydrolase [Planctomycetota bacterium]